MTLANLIIEAPGPQGPAGTLDVSSLTAGSVLFVGSGALAEDNANFFWDDDNDFLKVPYLETTIATGTAPLIVASTTLVSNLNADLLDSQEGSFYRNAGNINAGTLAVARGGTASNTALNNNRLMWSASNAIVESDALTNGQVFIGSTGAAPVAATISGTANQVTVTPGAGSLTLGLPQNLHAGASVTFADLSTTSSLDADFQNVSTSSTAGGVGVRVMNTDQTVNNWAKLGFADGAADAVAAQWCCRFIDHTNNYGQVRLNVRGASGFLNAIEVLSTGLVGINITAPARRLEVRDTDNQLRLSESGSAYCDFSVASGALTITPTGTHVEIADGKDVKTGTTTGTTIGTAASEKLSFHNATPVVQHATTGQTAGFTAGTGTAVNDDSTFTGGTGATAYTLGDVVRALKLKGLMQQ